MEEDWASKYPHEKESSYQTNNFFDCALEQRSLRARLHRLKALYACSSQLIFRIANYGKKIPENLIFSLIYLLLALSSDITLAEQEEVELKFNRFHDV